MRGFPAVSVSGDRVVARCPVLYNVAMKRLKNQFSFAVRSLSLAAVAIGSVGIHHRPSRTYTHADTGGLRGDMQRVASDFKRAQQKFEVVVRSQNG